MVCRRLDGPHGWSGQLRKISPPNGIRSRTVEPVASRYTDWAIPIRHSGVAKFSSLLGYSAVSLSNRCLTFRKIVSSSSSWRNTSRIPPPDGATARGGPWPPLQYASRPLGSLLSLSLHSFTPISLRSMDTSSSHLILGLPLRLVAYIFPYSIVFGIAVSCILSICPDRPWGPPSLLYNGYRVFPRVKERPGRDADPSPPSSAVVKKEQSYTSTPPMGRRACTEPECLYVIHPSQSWSSSSSRCIQLSIHLFLGFRCLAFFLYGQAILFFGI